MKQQLGYVRNVGETYVFEQCVLSMTAAMWHAVLLGSFRLSKCYISVCAHCAPCDVFHGWCVGIRVGFFPCQKSSCFADTVAFF